MSKKNQITGTTKPSGRVADKQDIDFIKYVSFGLVFVLFIGFAGMFVGVGQMTIDSMMDKRDSTYDLEKKVDEQNNKIDALTNMIKDNQKPTVESN